MGAEAAPSVVSAAPATPGTGCAHIALFIRSLAGGGAERSMVTLAGAFAARGHRVDLVLGRRRGVFGRDLPEGVRCVDLGGPDWVRTASALLRDRVVRRALGPVLATGSLPRAVACAPALADYLRRERPDALFSALVYSNLAAIWARRLAGSDARLVVSERNAVQARVARDPRRRVRKIPALMRRFYPEADAVACVSRGVAEDVVALTGLPRERVSTTYNPVVTDDLLRGEAGGVPHRWLAPGEPPVVLGVGKLKPQKDFATLIGAFARLRRERPARLVILGEGPEDHRLLARARALGVADDVALPGFVEDPYPWMRRAAVFALSSAWEGLPGVLIQALACGCAVVSTDCPHGPAEILEGGRHGPLVPVGDEPALADALARVLERPPARESLVRRASDFAVAPVVDATLCLLLGPARTASRNDASCSATTSTV